MTLDIAKLRSLLAAATPGRWKEWGEEDSKPKVVTCPGDGSVFTIAFVQSFDHRTANAELIAAAVNALPKLLAIAEAAEVMRDAWGEAAVGLYPNSPLGRLFATLDAARKETP